MMPHIIVKLIPGRTEEQKKELTDKIVQAVMETVDAGESSISVSFEEVPSEKWEEEVYQPDILGKDNTLYKKPGYRY
ncbi:tautomerase family protein [Neobacillus drentensis]|uniref:tautomerase family protein n=1 Tax=Neobacillus drentensis TaxID=220684 RepID=UPI001F3E663C|nr:tautomerase family protein [Neobacillus drentensis]ULT54518.1 tautomerase family protein [Neobacillus drentensis]